MKHNAMLLPVIVVCLAGCASAEDKANLAYDSGDYPAALAGYQALAAKGDPHADDALVYMYYTGTGVPKDVAAAHRWYEKAALDGDDTAARNLGSEYLLPAAGEPDYAQAFRWFKLAADRGGDAYSGLELSILYEHGLGVARDAAAAQRWIERYVSEEDAEFKHILHKTPASDKAGFRVALDQAVWQAAHYAPEVQPILSGKTVMSFRWQEGRAVDVAVLTSSGDANADAVAVGVLQKALLPPVPASLSQVEQFKIGFDFEQMKREPSKITYGRPHKH